MAIIGIDLGTSNSMVSYWNGENCQVIKNVFGNTLTPSVVALENNEEILVGEIAKEKLITNPENTIYSFKRFMGTEKKYRLGKYTFTPVELSSLILKNLKMDAEKTLGEECHEAVISVPAYFNNKQREATKMASELAGLKVLNLISEPTAAAVSYGLHEEIDSTILVLDLGGGTFDVSLLEIFEGVIQVNAISGDNHLGGEDFTEVILKDFLSKTNLNEKMLNLEFISILRKKCENLKKIITNDENKSFKIEYKEKEYEYSLNIIKYETLVENLLERLKSPIVKVLKDTNTGVSEIDKIILIGGATKSEVIKKYITKLFGKFPYTNINPDESVGIGAGIQTALKLRDEKLEEVILTDVCAHSLGIETVSTHRDLVIRGNFTPIIERNTTIPISIVKSFSKVEDNQTKMNISVYQGESNKVEDNLFLGNLVVPMKPNEQDIDVRFTYDSNGILEVDVKVVGSETVKKIVMQETPGTLTKKEIEEIVKKFEKIKIHPREKSENKFILEKAKRIYTESLGEKREYVGHLIEKFEYILEKQIPTEIEKEAKELNEILNSLESEIF